MENVLLTFYIIVLALTYLLKSNYRTNNFQQDWFLKSDIQKWWCGVSTFSDVICMQFMCSAFKLLNIYETNER